MQYFFWWILFHNPNTPHISSQTICAIPNAPMSSQTLNVIPNLLRDLIIVPQNRSFQASLSGHPPRRRKLLLRWTASQAFQSLPLHKNFYACRKYKEKLHQTSKLHQRAFAQNRKPIFFLRSESRRSRLTRVPYWCQRFSYTIKMCINKTTSRFRKVIQQKVYKAEVHCYQCKNIGKVEFKLKRKLK